MSPADKDKLLNYCETCKLVIASFDVKQAKRCFSKFHRLSYRPEIDETLQEMRKLDDREQLALAAIINDRVEEMLDDGQIPQLMTFAREIGAKIYLTNPPRSFMREILRERMTLCLTFDPERRQWFEAAYKCGIITDADLERVSNSDSEERRTSDVAR